MHVTPDQQHTCILCGIHLWPVIYNTSVLLKAGRETMAGQACNGPNVVYCGMRQREIQISCIWKQLGPSSAVQIEAGHLNLRMRVNRV